MSTLMAHKDKIGMKKTTENPKTQVMDGGKDGDLKPGEVKPGKINNPRGMHLKNSESGKKNSREAEGVMKESRMRGQRERDKKKMKMGREGKGTYEEGKPAEKKARRGSEEEKGQNVEESLVINQCRGQESSKVV